jgi:hypothetical protein
MARLRRILSRRQVLASAEATIKGKDLSALPQ